jgi:predicted RNase H-like nuclease (RuvC/YqgF family)
MSLVKGMVRFGVIAGLAGGALVLIAGPDQAAALFRQTRDEVRGQIGKNIKDPVALRAQLRSLEEDYPRRIAAVRGDLAELREQKSQLARELAVSRRVIELAQADLAQLQELIARAESASTSGVEAVSYSPPTIVRIVFNNEPMDLSQAYARGTKIQQVLGTYAARVNDIHRDMGYLEQQESRLDSLLTQLENEHAQFQTQLWHLDRQVDSIARNDRMIEMMRKRQRTIDEQSRYRAHSLEQLQGRFAEIRAKQEAQLESFGRVQAGANYEDRAKIDLDARGQWTAPGAAIAPDKPSRVIKITPETPARREPSI